MVSDVHFIKPNLVDIVEIKKKKHSFWEKLEQN